MIALKSVSPKVGSMRMVDRLISTRPVAIINVETQTHDEHARANYRNHL